METHVEIEKNKTNTREVRIAKGFEAFLKNQILYIRMLFLSIEGLLLKTIYFSLQDGRGSLSIYLIRGLSALIVFVLFIATFAIEQWDKRDQNIKNILDTQANQKSQIFRYFIDQVIPNVKSNDEKMKLGKSLSDMLSVVNIQEVKKDMAVLISAQSSFLSSMVNEISQLKNEVKEIIFDKLPGNDNDEKVGIDKLTDMTDELMSK